MKTYKIVRYIAFLALTMLILACKKDKPATGIDAELYNLAKETNGFVWYKLSDELLDKSAGSGHNSPYLRTRYNNIAANQLDSIGKVKEGAVFAEGSLIVKELRENENTLTRYSILYKQSDHKYADDQGWLWGYINEDKTVRISAEEKGSSCIGCHLQDGNIDYMLMNKYFP